MSDERPVERTLLTGWGGTAPTASDVVTVSVGDLPAKLQSAGPRGLIPRGLGRSYGDIAQNSGGEVLAPLAAEVEIDSAASVVRVGAGTRLHDLIRALLPAGYFVPVTPGTRYVTLGGAVACDVHGKNHHRAGSIGNHVLELDLVTPDGLVRTIGPDRDPELFHATVGGLGLTGVMTSMVLRLLPVETGYMRVDTERLPDLETAMARIQATDRTSTYTVAWIDTMARGRSLGRSVLTTGEHATAAELSGRRRREPLVLPASPRLVVPDIVPPRLVGRTSVRAFNEMWFRRAPRRRVGQLQTIASFFHPLDGVDHWSRLYGPRGAVQYQLVIPDPESGRLTRVLERIATSGHASFLAVVKRFGPGNAGFLSFPTAGWTLAVDFPVQPDLTRLLTALDREVLDCGGRVYLAKDSRVAPETLAAMYPRLPEFRSVRDRVDPLRVLRSDLSRRLDL